LLTANDWLHAATANAHRIAIDRARRRDAGARSGIGPRR
jgi:hypothetical protein